MPPGSGVQRRKVAKPLNLPEPTICDMNCFLIPNHQGPHQYDPEREVWRKEQNEKHNDYRRKNPDGIRAINLKQAHKMTVEEYNIILAKQNYVCAVCRRSETHTNQFGLVRLAVDHDRSCCPGDKSCGKCTRGLLCHGCNTAEGLLRDPETARRLADYMENNQRLISCYLSGPMAGCTLEEMRGWREALKVDFTEINWIDPCNRNYGPQQWRQLVEDDIADIKKSDFMLVNFWKPGVGTSMEMVVARQLFTPVITVTPDFKTTSPWIRYYSDFLVESFEHAIKIIKAEWGAAGVEEIHHE